MNKKELDQQTIYSALPVVGALFLIIAAAAYIIYKAVSNHAYNMKWKDYDECGIQ